jgi:hypothetical protein
MCSFISRMLASFVVWTMCSASIGAEGNAVHG